MRTIKYGTDVVATPRDLLRYTRIVRAGSLPVRFGWLPVKALAECSEPELMLILADLETRIERGDFSDLTVFDLLKAIEHIRADLERRQGQGV